MDKLIAYCGLACDTCPIHLATLEQDESHKRSIRNDLAEQCSKYYGMKMKADDINDCNGCRSALERLFSGCLNCEIRKCVIHKGLESYAYCSGYICETLRKHFSLAQDAQARLEEIREAN